MTLPANAQAIYSFLVGKGLSPNAAAGIAGNMERESGGNPESVGSGGGGLYGATPLPAGMVTGNATADLTSQLNDLMQYIAQNGSVSNINANASSPAAAATYFMNNYERPAAATAALDIRVQAANDVAAAAKSGNWKGSASLTSGSGSTTAAGGSGGGGGLLSFPSQITDFFKSADTFVTTLMWITKPEHWVRVLAFLAGIALLLFAIHALIAVGEGGKIIPDMPSIVPVPV